MADEWAAAIHGYCRFRVFGPPVAHANFGHLFRENPAQPSKAVVALASNDEIAFAQNLIQMSNTGTLADPDHTLSAKIA